ncbi:MAG: type V CRISPR-associated endonuclease Cas1 [bacterium]
MLSLPDFREKQILFISGKNAEKDKIKFSNDNICLLKENKIENQVSCYKIFALFVVGDCSLTTVLMRNCQKYGVSLFLMKNNFETYAFVISIAEGNYLLRTKQYEFKEDLEIAKKIVANKIHNQIILLEKDKKQRAADYLKNLKIKIPLIDDTKDLLGIEGCASKFFFQNYFRELGWVKRMPRTKIDIVNTLMDLGYTILFNFIDGLLGVYGFDAYKGFYHKLFFQRKSLVCDMMEPFRCLIDKQILKSCHLGQINKNDFKLSKGKFILNYETQRKYLEFFSTAIMDKKEAIFCYTKDFYYFLMNDSQFPEFKID